MMCPRPGLLLTCQLEAGEVALKAWEEAPGRGGGAGLLGSLHTTMGQLHPSEKDI